MPAEELVQAPVPPYQLESDCSVECSTKVPVGLMARDGAVVDILA